MWRYSIRKWKDYVYIQCEYKSTKQKINRNLFGKKNKSTTGVDRLKAMGVWIRGTNIAKDTFLCVTDRKQDTLSPIIQSDVHEGATNYHDDCVAYQDLQHMGYEHGTVVHKYGFVSILGLAPTQLEVKYIHIYTHLTPICAKIFTHGQRIIANFKLPKTFTRKTKFIGCWLHYKVPYNSRYNYMFYPFFQVP